jgi:hypothetical protein
VDDVERRDQVVLLGETLRDAGLPVGQAIRDAGRLRPGRRLIDVWTIQVIANVA